MNFAVFGAVDLFQARGDMMFALLQLASAAVRLVARRSATSAGTLAQYRAPLFPSTLSSHLAFLQRLSSLTCRPP